MWWMWYLLLLKGFSFPCSLRDFFGNFLLIPIWLTEALCSMYWVTNSFSCSQFLPGVLPKGHYICNLHSNHKAVLFVVLSLLQCLKGNTAWLPLETLSSLGCSSHRVSRSFCHFSRWHIVCGVPVLQKPLVCHPGDALTLEKVRQCEIHMQPQRDNCCRTWLAKFPTRSKRIDVISRITFPLVFALFNLVYWSTYLFREEAEENWAVTLHGTKRLSSRVITFTYWTKLSLLTVLKFWYIVKKVV
jgi:hypothetical protein